jgi:hypothetical protein
LTFATVRHRKVTKGPGSKAAGIAMAFKLIEAAQERWRAVNAPHLVALVRAGARFECGKLVERDHILEATQAAEDTPVQPPAAVGVVDRDQQDSWRGVLGHQLLPVPLAEHWLGDDLAEVAPAGTHRGRGCGRPAPRSNRL